MSEPEVSPPARAEDAGALLRQARERAGVHIATLAGMLKVPVQRLQALEDGAYDALPDATFTRALALSVCRALKIDPAPVLAALPTSEAPRLTPSSGDLDTPMPRKGAVPAFSDAAAATARRGPLLLALLLLLAAALAWWSLPAGLLDPVPAPAASSVAEPVATSPAAMPAQPAPAGSGPSGTVAGGVAVSDALPSSAPAPAASEPAAREPAPGAAGAAAPAGGQTAEAAPAALLLRASASSWIQVTGASGRVLLQRNVAPGETLRFDEDLPLAVVVGRADATQAEVRGRPLDLAALARNNVARFEVR